MSSESAAFLLTVDSVDAKRISELGGKGRNLYRLSAAGFSVPTWVVLGARALEEHCREAGLLPKIGALTGHFNREGVAEMSSRIQALITGTQLSARNRELVRAALAHLGDGDVAVRSSAVEEDGDALSYAGQFASYLHVITFEGACDAVVRCWASYYSERAILYRHHHGIGLGLPRMAVVLQKMVAARTSGVLFTRNPINRRADQLVLSAVHGLGEGLVSGEVDADTIWLNRDTGAIDRLVIGDKATRYIARLDRSGCEPQATDVDERAELALSLSEIFALKELAERIEACFHSPQDVEWAIEGREIHLLQTRPITGLPATHEDGLRTEVFAEGASGVNTAHGERIWDHSNIVESFAGITSPLTFSVARHIYHRLFLEFYRYLGVPLAECEMAEPWMRSMLGQINGRVYYNLLNWYQMLRPLPLFGINRRMFDAAIGVEESLPDSNVQAIPLFRGPRRSHLRHALVRARIVQRFLGIYFAVERESRSFLDEFYAEIERFEQQNFADLGAMALYSEFASFEEALLPRFGRMMALETIMDLTWGLLRFLTRSWLPTAPSWFIWQVIRHDGDIESFEPVRCFDELVLAISESPELTELVVSEDPAAFASTARARGHVDFARALESYLQRFGYRSLQELKLEAPSMRDDPAILPIMLRSALAARKQSAQSESAGASEVEEILSGLPRWKRVVYERVRGDVRKTLQARESVRFCRTRCYGILKRIMRAMGRELTRAQVLRDPSDIFYLRLEELRGSFEGTFEGAELRRLVSVRRDAAESYARWRAPARFRTQGLPYRTEALEQGGWRVQGAERAAEQRRTVLAGTPSAPGDVQGEARIIRDIGDVGRGILVTYSTDAGWVGLLPSATGLLVEKGSPLSHVAIVAREMGVPTIVQVKHLMDSIENGDRVRMDGSAGRIELLPRLEGPDRALDESPRTHARASDLGESTLVP